VIEENKVIYQNKLYLKYLSYNTCKYKKRTLTMNIVEYIKNVDTKYYLKYKKLVVKNSKIKL